VWHASLRCVTWLIWAACRHSTPRAPRGCCDWDAVTHFDVELDSYIHVTWPILTCDLTHLYVWYARRDSFLCLTWLICAAYGHSALRAPWDCWIWVAVTQDVTHFYVWHFYLCDMTHLRCVRTQRTSCTLRLLDLSCRDSRRDSFLCVTFLFVWHDSSALRTVTAHFVHLETAAFELLWLWCTHNATHIYVSRDSFLCVTWRIAMCIHRYGTTHVLYACCNTPPWCMFMRATTHFYVWHDTWRSTHA